jgi:hypothetical protein
MPLFINKAQKIRLLRQLNNFFKGNYGIMDSNSQTDTIEEKHQAIVKSNLTEEFLDNKDMS